MSKKKCEEKNCMRHELLKKEVKEVEDFSDELAKMEEVKKILKDNQFILMFFPNKITNDNITRNTKKICTVVCENKAMAECLHISSGSVIEALKDNHWKH